MADIVTFDPVNLLINEINTGSYINEINALEIYSEWKDWLLADPGTRLGYPQAFTPVGGDPITANQSLGITYFLENGWRIKPAEFSHKMTVVGNVYTREEGESIFTGTLGNYNVHTETRVSNLADAFIASLDLALLAQQTTQMKYMVESLRVRGKGFGNIYYWDPVSGSNANDGLLPTTARQTFASIHDDLVTDGSNDVVYFVTDVIGETLIVTESVSVTKTAVHVRGPGSHRVSLHGDADDRCAVALSGTYTQFDGFTIIAPSTTSSVGICVVADHISIENCYISGAGQYGLYMTGVRGVAIHDSDIVDNFGDGVYIKDSEVEFCDTTIRNNGLDGVQIVSSFMSGSFNNSFDARTSIFGNGRWAMFIDDQTLNTTIAPGAHIQGLVIDSGSATYNAALIQEQAAYVGEHGPGVFVDQMSGSRGTAFPIGSVIAPVDNFGHALEIGRARSLPKVIYALGDYAEVDTGHDYSYHRILGQGPTLTTLYVTPNAQVVGCEFTECTVTGTLDGKSIIRQAIVGDLDYIDGYLYEAGLNGTITLSGQLAATFVDCWSFATSSFPVIDCGGSGSGLNMTNFNGAVLIRNKNGGEPVRIIANGRIVLDIEVDATGSYVTGSITSGSFELLGIGQVTDRLGKWLDTGRLSMLPGFTIYNQMLHEGAISKAVWTEQTSSYQTDGTFGRAITEISASLSTPSRGEIK